MVVFDKEDYYKFSSDYFLQRTAWRFIEHIEDKQKPQDLIIDNIIFDLDALDELEHSESIPNRFYKN